MFNPEKIYTNFNSSRFLCICNFNSIRTAKYIEASFLMSVREYYFPADLYVKGSTLIIDTPNRERTVELAILLNNSISNLRKKAINNTY